MSRPSLFACVVLAAGFLAVPAQAAPGEVDMSFGSGGTLLTDISGSSDAVTAVAVQPDGKVLAAGLSATGSDQDFALARYDANGNLDASFGSGGKVLTDLGAMTIDTAQAVALQPNGKIVAAGWSVAGGNSAFALVRYNPDGRLDSSFGSGGKVLTDFESPVDFDVALAVAIQPDGKIVAAGYTIVISRLSPHFEFALARYTTDGSLDPSFGSGGRVVLERGDFEQSRGVAIQPDGKIVVAGFGLSFSADFALVRYDSDGGLDPGFGEEGRVLTDLGSESSDAAFAVTLQPNGRIVVAGATTAGGSPDFALARYVDDGSLDASFGSAGKVITDLGGASIDVARAVALQPDGKVVAAGYRLVGNGADFALARYDSGLDASFGSGGKVLTDLGSSSFDMARAVAIQPSGRIVAAGNSDATGSSDLAHADFGIVRYLGR